MTANVLVFTPTYSTLLRPETIQSVAGQEFDGTFYHEISRHNPTTDAGLNVWAQYRRGRNMTLDGGYDAMMTVEHDMMIPSDALQRLYETSADVVYGVYLLRHKSYTLNAYRYEGPTNIGMSLMHYPTELALAKDAGVWEVSGVAFGCTLIRRNVLERYSFDVNPRHRYPDMDFAEWCVRNGVRQLARLDVECLHYCPEDGRWLEIGKHEMGQLVKVRALQSVTAYVVDRNVRMEQGNEYEVSVKGVNDLQRAGFVELVEVPQEKPEIVAKAKRGKRAS